MLNINFYPDSDLGDYTQAINEYEEIWRIDGKKICDQWEKITNLSFKESTINAIVANLRSGSHPLTLRSDITVDQKKIILIHELGHRILYKRVNGMKSVDSFGHHKFLYLVLCDVFEDLFGKEFLLKAIEYDNTLPDLYANSWKWALAYSKEERLNLFNRILNGDLSIIT